MTTKDFLGYMLNSGKIKKARYDVAIAKIKTIEAAKLAAKKPSLTKAELQSIVDILGGGK